MPYNQDQVKNDLIEVADGLVAAKKWINEKLSNEIHGHTRIFVETRINQVINRLNFTAGRSMSEGPSQSSVLTPLVNFFGEEMKQVKEVTPEILGPNEERKKIFVAKLDKLQADFPTLSNEEVLESYPSDDDQIVIRGLAKRAGVVDYKSAKINSEFLDKIRDGLKEIEVAEERKTQTEMVIANTTLEEDDEDLAK